MESTSKLSNIFKTIDDHFARFAFNHNVFIVKDMNIPKPRNISKNEDKV